MYDILCLSIVKEMKEKTKQNYLEKVKKGCTNLTTLTPGQNMEHSKTLLIITHLYLLLCEWA